jgi:membrane protein implicated in regulation of membrane protease activity
VLFRSFLLDGAALPVAVTADGGFTSELPRITSGRRRRLVIRVSGPRAVTAVEQWAAALRLPAPVRLAAPVFGGRAVQRRFYWEIMARADEHLLARPGTWTSQQRWTWESTGFAAVPVVTTAALADWLEQAVARSPGQTRGPNEAAAAATAVAPPLVERRSVFSGVGHPGDHRLWLVPSWCLVLCCSGALLAAGLSLAYLPALRRPGAVVPAAAAVVLAAVAAPGLAPLVAQAAVPGVLLVLLAWFLRATVDRGEPGIDLRPDEVAVSASTLTRELSGSPSVVITQSSVARERSAGTSVGSGS